MASRILVVFEGGNYKGRASSAETIDFTSIKVGASLLEIKETTGHFDLGAKKLTNIASGGAAGEALSYTQRGAANGVASLDGASKVPASQLPNSVMEFQGVWDASTNTPTLADGTGNAGDVYRVNVAGTQNLGSGAQTFVVADWVMYSGAIWQKAHAGADVVLSVNTKSGVVVLDTGDLLENVNLFFTEARVRSSVLTGFVSGAGTVSASDSVLSAINKLDGNISVLGSSANLAFTNDNAGTISIRQAVYVKANGNVDLAQATVSNLPDFALGLVASSSIATTASGNITVKYGEIISGFTGLTPGKRYYVDPSTAGDITITAPSASGQFIYQVGRALSTTKLRFEPSFILEIA